MRVNEFSHITKKLVDIYEYYVFQQSDNLTMHKMGADIKNYLYLWGMSGSIVDFNMNYHHGWKCNDEKSIDVSVVLPNNNGIVKYHIDSYGITIELMKRTVSTDEIPKEIGTLLDD